MSDTDQGSSPAEGDASSIITIVLADDHAVVRSALRMLLEAEAGFEVETFRMPPEREVEFGLLRDEWIYIARKP